MPPHVLKQVCTTMHIDIETSYYLNLGVDRPNITWEVRHMRAGKSDLESLRLVLPKKFGGEGNENDFKQTMVFGDDINILMSALFHSRRSPRAKEIILERFAKGKIKVLFTTEAAGMGCDLPHIELVVQFMACAVLLVQPTVFQQKVKKEAGNADGQPDFVKNAEGGLRTWLEANICRRDVADEYFVSGVKRQPPTGACCDNCAHQTLPECPSTPDPPPGTIQFIFESPSKILTTRRDVHLREAKTLLVQWRYNTWLILYANAVPFGPSPLLPDPILDKITSKCCLDVDTLIGIGWSQRWAKKHGEDILQVLHTLDNSATKRANVKEERPRKRAEKQAQPKQSRPPVSRSKIAVLGPSITENVFAVQSLLPLPPPSQPQLSQPILDDFNAAVVVTCRNRSIDARVIYYTYLSGSNLIMS
ncbi:hypothetical protein V8E55_008599 [Tylopilus felleus]